MTDYEILSLVIAIISLVTIRSIKIYINVVINHDKEKK